MGFFVLPTGTGKTPLFLNICYEAQQAAIAKDDELKVAIVVPTRQLLDQTYESIREGWIPNTDMRNVGRFGDGHRQLGHDINIYTYHAWVDLTRKGRLGSHNVDILISDEAHRGTSEVRVEEIFSKFEDNGTACLAFTATYRFDDEGQKSVERTHRNKIIERDIKTCVQEGELAA